MAKIKPSYGDKVLSKIKIGTSYYDLKDSTLKAIIESFTKEIVEGTIGKVSDNDGSFVTAQNIKAYVDSAVAVGLVIEVVDTLPEATADEMGKIYLKSHSHESGDNYDEYIVVRTGTEGSYVYTWEKIGNTDIDLSGYVSDVKYEEKSLKVQKGKGEYSTIHTFGSMADANTASGKVLTADSASFNYTPGGDVKVTLKDSTTATEISSSGRYTPKGSVTGKAIDGGSVNVTLGEETTGTGEATVSYESYTPSGKVSAPTITTNPTNKDVNVVSTNGTLPSFTAGTFTTNVPTKIDVTKFSGGSMTNGSVTFPTLTGASVATKPTGTFAKLGLIASVGSGDEAETLILESAETGSAITDVTINGGSLNGGSYTAPVLTPAALGTGFYTAGTAASKTADSFNAGKLPTLASQSVVTAVSATATAPTFTGTSADIKVSGVTYKKPTIASASFTGNEVSLGFTGTAEDITVTGSYNKQVIDSATFTGTKAATDAVSLNKTDKTVTVNPD